MLILIETFLNGILIFLLLSLIATWIWHYRHDCFACRLARLIVLILLTVVEVGLLTISILTGDAYFLNVVIIVLLLLNVCLASIRLRDTR